MPPKRRGYEEFEIAGGVAAQSHGYGLAVLEVHCGGGLSKIHKENQTYIILDGHIHKIQKLTQIVDFRLLLTWVAAIISENH